MDALLAELFRAPADPPVRPDGPTARILRDLWLGGMPLTRAATAAGLTSRAAEETLRHLGLLPAEPGRRPARDNPQHSPPEQPAPEQPAPAPPAPAPPAPKRPRPDWSALRADAVRLYQQGHTIRAIATKLGMHQREVWRQLVAAGVPRRPCGICGVVLSRSALERLYVRDQLPVAEVARRFDVSNEAVIRNLRDYGLPRRSRRTPLDRDTLRRLYVDERLGARAVAARLGVSPDKVRAELARFGIPVRPPGRPGRGTP